jgi:hypothetical protein
MKTLFFALIVLLFVGCATPAPYQVNPNVVFHDPNTFHKKHSIELIDNQGNVELRYFIYIYPTHTTYFLYRKDESRPIYYLINVFTEPNIK